MYLFFSKFNCSVHKHIEEGICLPVSVRLVLTKNVTIRCARHCLVLISTSSKL